MSDIARAFSNKVQDLAVLESMQTGRCVVSPSSFSELSS